MEKQTKLTEKSARMPDPREKQWEKAIVPYLREVESLNKESARSHRFAMLMQQLFNLEPDFIEKYVHGIEQTLTERQKDCVLRGEADNLFGNVIIEFEAGIPKKRDEAEDQLRRYVAILWSREPAVTRTPYLCIATDGVRFLTYSPMLARSTSTEVRPEDIRLQLLEETNWTTLLPQEVYYWLDRYLLRKEILHPTSETIVHDFGVNSHAFQTTTYALNMLWQEVKIQSSFAIVYQSWEKYLCIVYGSDVAGDELFIRHTYLATLAKLMSWMRIAESSTLPQDDQVIALLEGRLFKAYGIENFIEEDFFSWLARSESKEIVVGTVRWLFSLLQSYNLRELSEDVLKSLYQGLVGQETRHGLGEFYTPDWLAHRIIRQLLDENPRGSVLDPTCGSGTFLYLTIKEKRERLGNTSETLDHILNSVYGVDVHPLAVIIAKTNYILALGDLLKKRLHRLSIPIYLADTMRLPEREITPTLWMQLPSYRVELDGREIHLPEQLLQNLPLYDLAIELAKDFAQLYRGRVVTFETFSKFLSAQFFPEAGNLPLTQALFVITETLKHFIETNRDSIWAFILKNIYKPLFLKRKFDYLVGNPPWIAFRFMDPAYQAFLKKQITKEYQLLPGRGELITHLEIATLFFVRAADLYLAETGKIVFVLPKSIFSADQHDGLRRQIFKFSEDTVHGLNWTEIWDCEKVTPLFNVPSCVLMARKVTVQPMSAGKTQQSIPGQVLTAKLALGRRNASLADFESVYKIDQVEFSLITQGKRSYWSSIGFGKKHIQSYYRKMFCQGATIVPRSFWFVQVKKATFGVNPESQLLATDDRAIKEAKAPYHDVRIEGNAETRFLFATLLSTDMLPFGHLDYRLVLLPIEQKRDKYKLVTADDARQQGFPYLASWIEKVESEWIKRRSSKAERMTALEWLDYRRKLTSQNPNAPYRVLYNTSGTFLTATVLENESIEFKINGQLVVACGFAGDTVTYYFDTDQQLEAYYLASVFNAPEVDMLVKPMQARGLFGPRHFHKKVLELPIPQFNKENPVHLQLAQLGQTCTAKVEQWLAGGGAGDIKSIGRLRGMVRKMLSAELSEIDELVKGILA